MRMEREKRGCRQIARVFMVLAGILFVFFWKTEKNLADWGNILWTTEYTRTTLLVSLTVGGAIGCGFVFLLEQRKKGKVTNSGHFHKIGNIISGWDERRVFAVSFFSILLSWLPVFLAYFPGICAYDAPVQTGQAAENYYFDHHPILHTMLVKGAMRLGSGVFGDTNMGIAVYTVCQMLFLAAVMSYGVKKLHHFGIRVRWQVLVVFLGMFYPFNWYMSVSMTKDTVFTGFLLLLLVALVSLLLENRQSLKLCGTDVALLVGTVGMILFRNNGKFAMLVPLVFLVLMVLCGKKGRKLWLRLLLVCGTAFLLGNISLSVLFSVTNAEQGDRREMLSMPIQQLARCMIYHGGVGVLTEDDGTMEDTDKALINDFLLDESYREYDPHISDPVKRHTNTYVVRYRSGDFLRTYWHLLCQYPGDFINAGLALNAGFFYPNDTSHAFVNVTEGVHNNGYIQTRWDEDTLGARGIYKDSKWPWLFEKLEQWADDNGYLKLPLLKYLFVPGVFLWYYCLLLGKLMINERFRMCLPVSLIAGYYLTMFLGPTVQLRYIYPVMVALPFLMLLSQGKYENEDR